MKQKHYKQKARELILNVANRVGGSHIGGSFSIVDFLIHLYSGYRETNSVTDEEFYNGNLADLPRIIFSKGHCYLSQLAALDAIFNKNFYTENYLADGSEFFGHPKKNKSNNHFLVSAGALGQGLTFGNGLSLSNKFLDNNIKIISIIGDGEFNEGSCTEALLFASQHKLNHSFVIDNNDQMSLGKTSKIFNLGFLKSRIEAYGLECYDIDGHSDEALDTCINKILNTNSNHPCVYILNTIKGKGVSFMEGDSKWHHRRFKENEFINAINELNEK
jgi:transketolase